MQPEETAVKSALYKPLHELTEDDITQITREDCRRYLKEKGMRRPSWNKSQAIQQVIMLKTLLETTPDSESGSRKRICFSRLNNIPSTNNNNITQSVPKGAEDSMSARKVALYSRKDLGKPDSSSGGLSGHLLAVNNDSTPSRITGLPSIPVGQMTILYCGKVNVYDDVPEDKARSILNIAANPHTDSAVLLPILQTVKMNDSTRVFGEESNILREETPMEGPSTRKASVQRYLDKKKYRFKGKRRAGITSCASLNMYFNHQIPQHMLSTPNQTTFYPEQV